MKPPIEKTDRLEFKKVLSLVRDGDYAHPGSEEAIRLVFENLPKDKNRQLLDVGCGLGATANFLQQNGFGRVTGIDFIADLIEFAQKKYSDCAFVCTDVCKVAAHLKRPFDLLYHFNSFYAFPDHTAALKALREVSCESARLIIFDYVDPGTFDAHRPPEEFDVIHNPIKLSDAQTLFSNAGWKITNYVDITDQYRRWYTDFVSKIQSKRTEIIAISSENVFDYALSIYSYILKNLNEDDLTGGIFYAETA